MERKKFSLLLCYPYSFGAQRKHVSAAVGDASDNVELATTHQRREVPVGSAAAELHQRRSAVPAGRITDVLSESNHRYFRSSGLLFGYLLVPSFRETNIIYQGHFTSQSILGARTGASVLLAQAARPPELEPEFSVSSYLRAVMC